MSIRTLPTTLNQIFCKTILKFRIIVKSIIDPDDNFFRNLCKGEKLVRILIEKVQTTIFKEFSKHEWVNPLMLTAAKTSLTMLRKSFRLKHNWQNITRGNVDEHITNNSPSNILYNHSQFKSYRQKYLQSRRQFLEEIFGINGLNIL